MIDHQLAIDCVVDGATDGDVGGDIVARFILGTVRAGLRRIRGHRGERDATRVNRCAVQQVVALRLVCRERGGGVRNVRFRSLSRSKGGVFILENHDHALHLGSLAVVVGVCRKDDLLTFVPALKHVTAAADGLFAIGVAVCMLGNDTDNGQGIKECVERLIQFDLNCEVIGSASLFDHREVALRGLGIQNAVKSEGDIFGGKGLAVGELDIVTNDERPDQAILRALVVGGEIVLEAHVDRRGQKSGLDKRFMHVLAATPRNKGVEAG